MDFNKGKEYCELLKRGIPEETIAEQENIDMEELYTVVDYADPEVSRNYLKHFCGAYINYMCLMWPGVDECHCPARSYEPHCPLNHRQAAASVVE